MQLPFMRWLPVWREPGTLRADLMAGLTGAVVVLPQGVAFATLAGLPPQYGLYAAMLPCIVAALFGSSRLMVTGPANAISLTTSQLISPLAAPFSLAYVHLVLALTFLVGSLQTLLGLARVGRWIDRVPHTVIVGFTTGVAFLIINSQLSVLTGIPVERGASITQTLVTVFGRWRDIHGLSVVLGVLTIAVIVAWTRWGRLLPAMLVGVVVGCAVAAWVLRVFPSLGPIAMVPPLPSALPAFVLPPVDLDTVRHLFSATLVMTLLALTEASAIARSLALRRGDVVDGNQEFIGQGLANLAGSFFSSYPSSGSFNRSGVNLASGARTPLAAASAAVWLVLILLLVKPLTGYLAMPVIAGLLIVVAVRLIDLRDLFSTWGPGGTAPASDRIVLIVTAIATITISLEWAILLGLVTAALVARGRSAA